MKRYIHMLMVALVVLAGVAGVHVPAAEAITITHQYKTGDGALFSTTNSLTRMSKCEVLCDTTLCVSAIRRYASVATGPVVENQLYATASSGGTKTIWWVPREKETRGNAPMSPDLSNGGYWDDLTGTTTRTCTGYK